MTRGGADVGGTSTALQSASIRLGSARYTGALCAALAVLTAAVAVRASRPQTPAQRVRVHVNATVGPDGFQIDAKTHSTNSVRNIPMLGQAIWLAAKRTLLDKILMIPVPDGQSLHEPVPADLEPMPERITVIRGAITTNGSHILSPLAFNGKSQHSADSYPRWQRQGNMAFVETSQRQIDEDEAMRMLHAGRLIDRAGKPLELAPEERPIVVLSPQAGMDRVLAEAALAGGLPDHDRLAAIEKDLLGFTEAGARLFRLRGMYKGLILVGTRFDGQLPPTRLRQIADLYGRIPTQLLTLALADETHRPFLAYHAANAVKLRALWELAEDPEILVEVGNISPGVATWSVGIHASGTVDKAAWDNLFGEDADQVVP